MYCAVFCVICIFFSLGLIIPGAADSVYGGEMPHLTDDNFRNIYTDYGERFEKWFSGNFAYRGKTAEFFSSIKERIFNTGNGQVIVGEDGFLFFDETIDYYTGADPLNDSELDAIVSAIEKVSDRCKAENVRFLFMCVPNKSTVYPEKIPVNYVEYEGESDLDRLYSRLDGSGTEYIDLRPVLIEAKKDGLLYYRRDTHWNRFGAGIASLAVMEKLGLPVAVSPYDEHTAERCFEGDLDALLYPCTAKYDECPVYERGGMFVYTSAFSGEMDMEITTRSAGEGGSLLIFRDSYANSLIEFFACDFSSVRFERIVPYRTDLIKNGDYDSVIVEISERKLRELLCR